jgi:hypothetical protein
MPGLGVAVRVFCKWPRCLSRETTMPPLSSARQSNALLADLLTNTRRIRALEYIVIAWRSLCLDARVSHKAQPPWHPHMQIQSVIPESVIRFCRRKTPITLCLIPRPYDCDTYQKTQAIVFRVLAVAHGANADAGQNGQSGYVMNSPVR